MVGRGKPTLQGDIFIVCNFINTHQRHLSSICSLPVHHEFTSMFISIIFWFGVPLQIDHISYTRMSSYV